MTHGTRFFHWSLALILVLAAAPAALSVSDPKPEAVAQTQQDSEAHRLLAQAKELIEADDWLGAAKLLNKAKKADPEIAEVYRLLGDFHTAFNRGWKAERFYKKAESLEKAAKDKK